MESRFRGWEWVCDGRPVVAAWGEKAVGGVERDGVAWRPCGRRVQTVYLPLPAMTPARWLGATAEAMGEAVALRLPDGRAWRPGADDPLAGVRRFACKDCWGVRWVPLTTRLGWNEVVAYLSGGLLYGREVARPGWVGFGERRLRGPASTQACGGGVG